MALFGRARPDASDDADDEVYTLVYLSTLSHEMAPRALERLLDTSRRSNAAQGITGLLTISERRVMQTLEGPEDSVRRLFGRISADQRHFNVRTVWTSRHPARRFPTWAMGYDDLAVPGDGPGAPDAACGASAPRTSSGETGTDAPDGAGNEYVGRRSAVLRRALASGDRLVATLAIILDNHRPEETLTSPSETSLQCAECRPYGSADGEVYPCPTARNAIWALEAALP